MLSPNLHEYMEEVGSAIWKFLREEGQGESCVHQMHMLFAGESKDIIARLLVSAAPRNFRDRGLSAPPFSHM